MNVRKTPAILICATLSVILSGSTRGGGWRSRGEDCAPGTRHARAEWIGPFRQAKCLESLDSAGLSAHVEATRQSEHARYLAIYQRPIVGTAPAPAPLPTPPPVSDLAPILPTMDIPPVAPPPPANTPVFPGPRVP